MRLNAISRYCSRGLKALFRSDSSLKKGTPDRRPKTPFLKVGAGLVSAVHRHAEAAAREGVGLFVVPGTVEQPGSATAKHVSSTAVILVDLDEGDIAAKSAHLAKHLGQPTLDVASGGLTADGQQKRHLYWRLLEVARATNVDEVCRLRKVIADKVGGDPTFASAHQPIRVAGSIHGKHGVRTKVALQASSELRYELAELVERVDAMPAFAAPQQACSHQCRLDTSLRATDLMSVIVREGGVDGITRFDAISKVIGHWIREMRTGRVSLEQAWLAVTEHNAACIYPSWPEDRLRHEFEALLRRDRLMSVPADGEEKQARARSSAGVAPDISEDGLADKFSRQHSQDWRFVSPWGAWIKWTGSKWKIDEIGEVFEVARLVCRDEVRGDAKSREARRIRSDRTIRALERIVRSDPRHAARPEDWDADPMLLNTPAGIVDLRTGELRPHDRSAAITRITRASPGDNCPQWRTFIDEITNGRCQLADYLMRVAGYCLSGETAEQCFFFLHGAGANGKSVFLSVLSHVLGDYAATAPLETFMAGRGERHPTDLAGLRGARLVTVNETETGRAWAESRIKAITGGDMLRVRLMHRDFFEFRPTFKLLVAGNHRPKLLGVGGSNAATLSPHTLRGDDFAGAPGQAARKQV